MKLKIEISTEERIIIVNALMLYAGPYVRGTGLVARLAEAEPCDPTADGPEVDIIGRNVRRKQLGTLASLLLALLFFFALPVKAQSPLTDAPAPHFNRKTFVIESSVLTAANILDGISTARDSKLGFEEARFPRGQAETLGTHPDAGRYFLVMGLEQAGEELLAYRLNHSQVRLLRRAACVVLLGNAGAHLEGFGNNLYIQNHRR